MLTETERNSRAPLTFGINVMYFLCRFWKIEMEPYNLSDKDMPSSLQLNPKDSPYSKFSFRNFNLIFVI